MKSIQFLIALVAGLASAGLVISLIASGFGGFDAFIEAWRVMIAIGTASITATVTIMAPIFIACVVFSAVSGWLSNQ